MANAHDAAGSRYPKAQAEKHLANPGAHAVVRKPEHVSRIDIRRYKDAESIYLQ